MARNSNMVELLRRLVRQQTVAVGQPITNIHGAVAGDATPLLAVAEQRWQYTTLLGANLPTLADLYAQLAQDTSSRAPKSVLGTDGIIRVGEPAESGAAQIILLRGLVSVPAPLTISLSASVATPQSEFAIYVDGVLQRRAVDAISLPIALDAGTHELEIIALSSALAVAVPTSLSVSAANETPPTPVWESVTGTYSDAKAGVPAVVLRWYNQDKAGGWILSRRTPTQIGAVTAITAVASLGRSQVLVFTVAGDQLALVSVGDTITLGTNDIGTVQATTYESATGTSIRVSVTDLSAAALEAVLARTGAMAWTGRYQEIARVRRETTAGVVQWLDMQVATGAVYEYRLRAFGVHDPVSLSSPSDAQWITGGDRTAPGSIALISGWPKAVNRQIAVKFRTPSDSDYAGVYAYFRDIPVQGTTTSIQGNGATDTSKSMTTNAYAGFTYKVTSGARAGDNYRVISNTATAFVFDRNWISAPASGTTYDIYQDVRVYTDNGVPNSSDSFTFVPKPTTAAPQGYGRYIFATFDNAGNEQSHAQAITDLAYFDYSASNDTYLDGYPTTEPRVVLNANQDAADVYVKVATNVAESVRLFVKTSEASGAAAYGLVVTTGNSTPRYVSSGTELGPSDWFYDGATYKQILAASNNGLSRDTIVRRYVRAQGQYSQLASTWDSLTLNPKGQPYLEAVDLIWDETSTSIALTATGGANCLSANWKIADNVSYTSPILDVDDTLTDGLKVTKSTTLSGAQRNKVWYGKVTPYNGSISDIDSLLSSLGSGVNAIYDARYGVSTTSGVVDSWADYRGSSGFGPSLTATGTARPAYDSGLQTLTFDGSDDILASANSSLFDLSGALSLVLIGSVISSAAVKYPAAIAAGPANSNRFMALRTNGSAPVVLGSEVTNTFVMCNSTVVPSTTRRVLIASKNASTSTALDVPNTSQVTATIPTIASGTNTLAIGSWSAGQTTATANLVVRACIILGRQATSGDITTIKNWAVTNHGVTLA